MKGMQYNKRCICTSTIKKGLIKVQKLTLENYNELSYMIIRLKQIKEEMRKTNSFKDFVNDLKQIAFGLDIMFGYENRVISGNLAYDIAHTDKIEVWYAVYKHTKLLEKYIYQGIYNIEYQKGLNYFLEIHRKNLFYYKLLRIKGKYKRG